MGLDDIPSNNILYGIDEDLGQLEIDMLDQMGND
jgi:hypothetical protein